MNLNNNINILESGLPKELDHKLDLNYYDDQTVAYTVVQEWNKISEMPNYFILSKIVKRKRHQLANYRMALILSGTKCKRQDVLKAKVSIFDCKVTKQRLACFYDFEYFPLTIGQPIKFITKKCVHD